MILWFTNFQWFILGINEHDWIYKFWLHNGERDWSAIWLLPMKYLPMKYTETIRRYFLPIWLLRNVYAFKFRNKPLAIFGSSTSMKGGWSIVTLVCTADCRVTHYFRFRSRHPDATPKIEIPPTITMYACTHRKQSSIFIGWTSPWTLKTRFCLKRSIFSWLRRTKLFFIMKMSF